MNPSTALSIREAYEESHTLLQHLIDQYPGHEWLAGGNPVSPPVVFHLWQTAREADVVQFLINVAVTGTAQQVWHRDGLARAWRFDPERLGLAETGIGLFDEEAASLAWPTPEAVTEYARSAFQAVRDAQSHVLPADYERQCSSPLCAVFGGANTLEAILLRASASANRHLGIVAWRTADRQQSTEDRVDLPPPADRMTFNGICPN